MAARVQKHQAVLRNATALPGGDIDDGLAVYPPYGGPFSGWDLVYVILLGGLAISLGRLMFQAKRATTVKNATNRDARVLGDERTFTRTRDV
jgi:hypothetical protein